MAREPENTEEEEWKQRVVEWNWQSEEERKQWEEANGKKKAEEEEKKRKDEDEGVFFWTNLFLENYLKKNA